MSGFVIAAAVAIVAGWIFWRAWGRPLLDLRDMIRAIANDESQIPIVRSKSRIITQSATDLGRISDRLRRQRRQLADEGFSLRAILGSMIEGVVIVDTSQRIRLTNDALQEMFAFHRSPINRTTAEVFQFPELRTAIDRAIKETRSINLEIHDEPAIGERRPERHFRIKIAPLLSASGVAPAGVLAVFDDITEVRVLEAVRREFVANVSHEFRTPLAIITGYVETLMDGAIEDRGMTERSLEVILKNGKRLNLLIDDLLTISHMEQRNPALNRASTRLSEIARHVVERLEARIAKCGAVVDIQFPEEADEAEVDGPRIEQALFNLVTNALQYASVTDPHIRIAGRRRGGEIDLTVSDNGPGIPYNDQPHIFERFYRVHKDRSRDAGGTGLGLSIVKNIVMAHGGHVSLRSTPGSGATFKIVLPMQAPRQ